MSGIDFQSYFEHPLLARALVACLLIGFTNGFVSGVVVLRKAALSVSALSHTLLPGIVLAILTTGVLSQVNAFLGALFAALIVGVGSLLVSRRSPVSHGTALAVLYTASFAAGVAVLPKLDETTELSEWLFGDVLTVTTLDLWIYLGVAGTSLLTLLLAFRPILLTLFEPNVAAAQGVPVRAIHYLLFALLVLSMVVSLQAVGCVLSIGMLVAPAATMALWTSSPKRLFWGGALLGAAGSVGGLFLHDLLEIAAGPAITIMLGGLFLVSFLIAPHSGLLAMVYAKKST